MSLETESANYGASLQWFIDVNRVPLQWFRQPDRITYAAPDIAVFSECVKEIKERKERLAFKDEGKYSVIAKLSGSIGVGSIGDVKWVEVDEAPPDEPPFPVPGVHAAEFFYPDIADVSRALGWRGIGNVIEHHNHHLSVTVIYDEFGNGFTLNNTPVDQIIKAELEANEARELM